MCRLSCTPTSGAGGGGGDESPVDVELQDGGRSSDGRDPGRDVDRLVELVAWHIVGGQLTEGAKRYVAGAQSGVSRRLRGPLRSVGVAAGVLRYLDRLAGVVPTECLSDLLPELRVRHRFAGVVGVLHRSHILRVGELGAGGGTEAALGLLEGGVAARAAGRAGRLFCVPLNARSRGCHRSAVFTGRA